MRSNPLPRPVVERLPRYYHFLHRLVEEEGECAVSSRTLAEIMGVDDTLVRRDLAAIGVKGQPKVGFHAEEVMATIRRVLGFDLPKRGLIAGAGRLGGAIAAYEGFWHFGLRIVAAVDIDPRRARERMGDVPVHALDDLERIVGSEEVNVGILTVPAEAAQKMADRFVIAGVRSLWNFAPVNLDVPPEIRLRDEFLSTGLAEISYRLAEETGSSPAQRAKPPKGTRSGEEHPAEG
jgi:redox-sensing transcriptional repressor